MKVVIASSKYDPPFNISAIPANCPADVIFVMEIKTAIQTGSPPSVAIMPKVNETERYPKQMGIPSVTPLKKVSEGVVTRLLPFKAKSSSPMPLLFDGNFHPVAKEQFKFPAVPDLIYQ